MNMILTAIRFFAFVVCILFFIVVGMTLLIIIFSFVSLLAAIAYYIFAYVWECCPIKAALAVFSILLLPLLAALIWAAFENESAIFTGFARQYFRVFKSLALEAPRILVGETISEARDLLRDGWSWVKVGNKGRRGKA